MIIGVFTGVAIGIGNALLGVIFPSWPAALGLLVLALLLVLVLHEGLHGLAGRLLGYHPIFGAQPPLVFTTFEKKVRRNHLVAIALAPLVVLDIVFVAAYLRGPCPTFWNLCFAVNTIGALGDLWITWKVSSYDTDVWFQDTKSGLEAWWPPQDAHDAMIHQSRRG